MANTVAWGSAKACHLQKKIYSFYRESRLSSKLGMGMGGNWELINGKKWECDLSFRWEWEWDGNGNDVIEMGGNWDKKSVPAHLYLKVISS